MLMGHEPAHVAPEEAVLNRRVNVFRLVRVDMMVGMMSCPPNRTALYRRGAQHGEDELPDPRGLEGAMGEIAMIEAGDGEHAHQMERDRHRQRDPAEAN